MSFSAPSTAPEELSLVVTTDNTALLADWKDVEPTRPVGPLAFYDVEFTSSRQGGVVNALRIDPDFSFSVITGIRGGNFYQVSATQYHDMWSLLCNVKYIRVEKAVGKS